VVHLEAADLDDDLDDDLVAVLPGEDLVVVMLSDGFGGFASNPYGVGMVPSAAVVGELDETAGLDILTTDEDAATMTLLAGDGAGGFLFSATIPTGGVPVAVDAADFDDDGDLDLIVADIASDNLAVFLRTPGSYSAPDAHAVPAGPRDVRVIALDENTSVDLVNTAEGGGGLVRLYGDGDGDFGAPITQGAGGSGPRGLVVGDFDGDGEDRDVAVAVRNSARVSIFLHDGDDAFETAHAITVAPSPVRVDSGDLDEDGVDDVVIAHSLGGLGLLLSDP
jgi:hypothetical protein